MKNSLLAILIVATLFSCKSEKNSEPETTVENDSVVEKVVYYKDGVLDVITEAMDFQTADTINSGWNKIVYHNNSPEVHFIMLDLYPSDSLGMDDVQSDLLPPFDDGMRFLIEGKPDSAMAAFGKLPAWFGDIRFFGGTGLISPGKKAISTVKLEPGKYLMECYVKMANGQWHTSHGMAKFIEVVEKSTTINPPDSNHQISLSSSEGIGLETEPSIGKQIFEVEFIDQKPYEHFMGHDVNLVKYDSSANLDSLVQWMNWMLPKGLATPSPEGITFMGGVNNLESGSKGYFEAELDAGNYLLISEVPNADEKGLFKKFSISN